MELNLEQLIAFAGQYKHEKIFMFGFTSVVYTHLYKKIIELKVCPDLSNVVLIHGGGWKKLVDEAVTAEEFKMRLTESCGIKNVYEYYGMVEQTGSIFMACEQGHFHAPVYSDVIIRRVIDFSVAEIGVKGIVQVLSILPSSYPGHSLLTEDEGTLMGQDDCACGRKGKYFKISGRLKNAEIRGCGNIHEDQD